MALKHSALLAALLVTSCSTQFSDPIQRLADDEPVESCAMWSTESECLADSAHGCTFQPNSIGCDPADPSCAAGVCRSGDPFVRRFGETLLLHDAPYRFVGTVSWGLAWSSVGCQVDSLGDQEEAISRTFEDLVAMRASALKLWAFQRFAGAGGRDYSSFERIVDAARRAGVRLILVLENQHPDCSSGTRDDAWYGGGYRAPYGDYSLSFRDYVVGLVEHFRDEPTILGWQLMHEARGEDFAALDGFAEDMSALLRLNDPNHLIVLGTDNGDSPATSRSGTPSNYQRLHAHQAIDLLDVHDFQDESTAFPTSFSELGVISQALLKPIFAGATAVELEGVSASDFELRARRVEDKLVAAMNAGLVGFLVYDYYPDWPDPGRQFDGRAADPLAGPGGVLSRHAPPNQ